MAYTVRNLAEDALREIGVLAANETASGADAAAGLRAVNDLVDQWAAEKLQIYAVVRTTWTITASTQTYTVGSGGDVDIARPMYIDDIKFQDTSVSPTQEYDLSTLTEQGWRDVQIKTLTSPFPTAWYYDSAYPLGTISFWPIPTGTTLQGVIYAPTAVAEFAALSTTIALPPGYRRMLIKNTAINLAPSYHAEVSPALAQAAMESVTAVKRSNKRLVDMRIEAGALGQGNSGLFYYSINVGP